MFTTNLNISNYIDRNYRVTINAAWITITDIKTGKVLTKREATIVPHVWPDNWYDERHQAVMKALYALETAIYEMVDADANR